MKLFVGTSGWAYATWKPHFYPEKLPQKKFLQYYSSQLNAVEINYTFRRMLSEKSVQTWLTETPQQFKFALKAHQVITHLRRLKDTGETVARFTAAIAPLEQAGRLGPVLFQLPPNFKADVPLLRDFLSTLPPGLPAAFEFREPSWFSEEVFQALSERKAALCIAESEERTTPEVHTGDFAYYRFRKPEYAPAEREAIAGRLRRLAESKPVFAFFKHEETPEGALWALEVLKMGQAAAA